MSAAAAANGRDGDEVEKEEAVVVAASDQLHRYEHFSGSCSTTGLGNVHRERSGMNGTPCMTIQDNWNSMARFASHLGTDN